AALRGALAEVAQPARLARAGAMTLAAWLLDFAATYWIVNAITPLSLVHSAVCQSLAAGAALVSFVPGGLGVATASFVGVADVLGADWQAVAAAGVLAVVLNQALRGGLALAALAHWAR